MSASVGAPPAFVVFNQSVPKDCQAKALRYQAQLASVQSDTLDTTSLVQYGVIDFFQSIYVDNFNNGSAIEIDCNITGQRVIVPANSQAWLPLLAPNPAVFTFQSTGAVDVTVFLCNMAMPAIVYAP